MMIEGYYAVDYQVHSLRSHDGRATIAQQCARAVELGLDEIGFSEHKDFDPADPLADYFDFDAYMTEIEAARDQWAGRLLIRAGIEIDYQVWFENRIGTYLDMHPFDFVLGSVHFVGRKMLMTPEYNGIRTRGEAYLDYFAAVADSVSSGLFDVVAHLEYANRRGLAAWGPYDSSQFRAELNEIFAMMVARDMPLEINTAGLHQGLGITYPTAETVALYAAQGGRRISIGSDAHHPHQLAHAYGLATRIALANGIDHVCTWHQRRIKEIPLVQASE
jgi:histidinol-phosphatase (PHP family)